MVRTPIIIKKIIIIIKKNESRIAKKRLTIPDEARAYRELSVDCCAIFLL
jgi:hypothetical protein